MTLHPVLLPIPHVVGLTARQRITRQREFARIALARCAELSGVQPWDWKKGDDDVPLPHDGLYWSISHKPMMAAAVIASAPVGIDVEFIEPRSEGMFDKLAAPEEWALFHQARALSDQSRALSDQSRARKEAVLHWPTFFRVWTAKEATLKANGVGVAGFLDARVEGLIDDRHMDIRYREVLWRVEHYYFGDHLAAVTIVDGPPRWHELRS